MSDYESNDYSPEDTLDYEYYVALEQLEKDPIANIEEAISNLEVARIDAWNRGNKVFEDRIIAAESYLNRAMKLIMDQEKFK